MKQTFLILLFLLAYLPSSYAQKNDIGLGVILGDPTGISFKTHLGGNRSVDGALSYSTGTYSGMQVHGDYIFDNAYRVSPPPRVTNLYYGLGARIISISSGDKKNKMSIGPRAPLGVNYFFTQPSLEIFAEIALIMDLVPSTSADLDYGIGLRIWF